MRPVEDEKALQRLSDLPASELRPEFVEAIGYLRQKVFKKARAKMVKGQVVTGSMIVELAQSYVTALNGGKVPTIESAWDNVQAAELERGFREAFEVYNNSLAQMQFPMVETEEKGALAKLKQ